MEEKTHIDKHGAFVKVGDKVYVSSEELKMDGEIGVVTDLLTADHIVFPFRVKIHFSDGRDDRTIGLKSSEVELFERDGKEQSYYDNLPYYCVM